MEDLNSPPEQQATPSTSNSNSPNSETASGDTANASDKSVNTTSHGVSTAEPGISTEASGEATPPTQPSVAGDVSDSAAASQSAVSLPPRPDELTSDGRTGGAFNLGAGTSADVGSLKTMVHEHASLTLEALSELRAALDVQFEASQAHSQEMGQLNQLAQAFKQRLNEIAQIVTKHTQFFNEIAQRIVAFEQHINKLTQFFNDRFREDKIKEKSLEALQAELAAKNVAFDKLYSELKMYKDDFVFKALKPVFLDLILLHDDMGRMIRNARDDDERRKFELLQELLREVLFRRDVERIDYDGKTFDRNLQKAISRVNTPNKAEDWLVHEVVRDGFSNAGKVLRPQEVVVKRYVGEGASNISAALPVVVVTPDESQTRPATAKIPHATPAESGRQPTVKVATPPPVESPDSTPAAGETSTAISASPTDLTSTTPTAAVSDSPHDTNTPTEPPPAV